MRASLIITAIEEFAPLGLQESFDNSGLQVGDVEQDIDSVLLATDVTEAVVDEAVRLGAGMIIAHHPLLFSGLKRISNDRYTARVVTLAIKNNIIIYAAHTNLDKCVGGVNYEMARRLGLENVEVLVPEADNAQVGLGCIGITPNPICEEEYIEHIKRVFDVKCVRHSAFLSRPVHKVALCGGSGSDFIPDAIRAHADIYITADVTYHKFFDAENQIVIADIGHFECESLTKDIFLSIISQKFPNFAAYTAQADQNPVLYS